MPASCRGVRMAQMELRELVEDFARGLSAADAKQPQASGREGRIYRPGIGPFGEEAAVRLTLDEMRIARPGVYDDARKLRYPGANMTCDLAVGADPEWAVEMKLARVGRENGTDEDTAVKKILSPYADDRSAVTDCMKLVASGFTSRKGILVYGFEDPGRPLAWLIDAFELIAAQHVTLGQPSEARFERLVHPIFQ